MNSGVCEAFAARRLDLGENRLPVAANCGTIPNAIGDSLLELEIILEHWVLRNVE